MRSLSEIAKESGIHRKVVAGWAKRMFPKRFEGKKAYLNSDESSKLVTMYKKYENEPSSYRQFETFMEKEGY